jgi:hypothetical protein
VVIEKPAIKQGRVRGDELVEARPARLPDVDRHDPRPGDREGLVILAGCAVRRGHVTDGLTHQALRRVEIREPKILPGQVQVLSVPEPGTEAENLTQRRQVSVIFVMYHGTMVPVKRVQTGMRMEQNLLKVLKGLAEYLDLTLGELLEGIVLHAFEGKAPFSPPTLQVIEQLRVVYGLTLRSQDSHVLSEVADPS